MHSRVARVMLVAGLVAVGIGAGLQLTFLHRQSRQLVDDQQQLLTRVARLDARLAELSSAQAAYVAPGQPDAPWLERVTSLNGQLTTDLTALRARLASPESAATAQAIAEALSQVTAADGIAREHLAQEQDLAAADVVFGEARDAINAARASAATIVSSEGAGYTTRGADIQQRTLLIAGGTAAIWLVGVLLLLPRARKREEAAPTLSDITRITAKEPVEPVTQVPAIDLTAAADLCIALSRVVTSAALPDMLSRTAALIDAPGVIVWMGSGDELFAVMSHGYDPRSIRRLGSIPREADNATAEAWRTGELRTVNGDPMANGAIVAPMFGPDGCIGVLAAEVRNGREHDAGTQAVTVMIAAQLAMIVGAWPAAPAARAAEA